MDTLYEDLYVFLYKSVAHYIFIDFKNIFNWICREKWNMFYIWCFIS